VFADKLVYCNQQTIGKQTNEFANIVHEQRINPRTTLANSSPCFAKN
jgi:hypothetical protein